MPQTIALNLVICDSGGVRRLTRDYPHRTAMVVDLAQQPKNALKRDRHVCGVICEVIAGSYEGDQTWLVDWTLDQRLPDALEAITTGRIDPVSLKAQGWPSAGW